LRRLPAHEADHVRSRDEILSLQALGYRPQLSEVSQAAGDSMRGIRARSFRAKCKSRFPFDYFAALSRRDRAASPVMVSDEERKSATSPFPPLPLPDYGRVARDSAGTQTSQTRIVSCAWFRLSMLFGVCQKRVVHVRPLPPIDPISVRRKS
jgi:hypothetical protein